MAVNTMAHTLSIQLLQPSSSEKALKAEGFIYQEAAVEPETYCTWTCGSHLIGEC